MAARTAEDVFRASLEANTADCDLRLIFADWLADQGRDVEAGGQRWQARNRQWPRPSPAERAWQWWYWEGEWWPKDYENGVFEASLPRDVWHAFKGGKMISWLFRKYSTLCAAETALAHALASLDLL